MLTNYFSLVFSVSQIAKYNKFESIANTCRQYGFSNTCRHYGVSASDTSCHALIICVLAFICGKLFSFLVNMFMNLQNYWVLVILTESKQKYVKLYCITRAWKIMSNYIYLQSMFHLQYSLLNPDWRHRDGKCHRRWRHICVKYQNVRVKLSSLILARGGRR